ncbi:MAG: 50S ribosomal protein L11 methyltransferase [Flavobacteriales bacterium]|nr:50S ribosomal protein L11 methyltransferase [Flavobacteriales bacterium]
MLAIDNDQQAVENARDNVAANACKTITVEKGDAGSLAGESFAVILANIERNTLLAAMPQMADSLLPGGALFLSGFIVADRPLLAESATAQGLILAEELNEGEWALLGCRKPQSIEDQ